MGPKRVDIASPRIIVPTGVSNVILVSSGQFKLESRPIYDLHERGRLGLLTIKQGLAERGFGNVSIFQSRPDAVLDVEIDRRAIIDQFTRMGAAERGAVIGISTTTSEYFKFEPLARLLREVFPDALLIAGGAHFFRDRIEGVPDTLEVALEEGLADAVQVGHAQAFIDFVTKYNGDMERAEGPGFYRIDHASGRVVGSGVGRYPELQFLPIDYDREHAVVSTLFKNACVHGCAYCCARLGAVSPFPADMAIESLNRFFAANKTYALMIVDSDPFTERDIDYYRHIFGSLRNRTPLYMSPYLNPILLLDADHQDKIFGTFFPGPGHRFFVGRDTAVAGIAAKIGSNDNRRPKSQRQLDEEHMALEEFIYQIKGSHKRGDTRIRTDIVISYIVTPFETMDSFMAMTDDVSHLLEMNDEGVRISVVLSPLMPFPGTPLRRKYRNSIDLGAYNFSDTSNGAVAPWKMSPDVTDFGIRMMRRIEQLYIEGKELIGGYIMRLAMGEIDVDGSEKRSRRSVTGVVDAGETSGGDNSNISSRATRNPQRQRRAPRSARRTAQTAVRSGVRVIAPAVTARPAIVRAP